MVSIKLFGGASLETDGLVIKGPAAQRHRMAVLALLAAPASRAPTRDKLMALLWPERDAEHARNLLNQAVYVLRKALGDDVILSAGEELRLGTAGVHCDVVAFREAVAAGDLERAVEAYTGPFLDGFSLSDAPEFEHWADGQRTRLSDLYGEALETLADEAEGQGELADAVAWWKARATHDPFDSRVALRLMQALVATGNPAGALQHAAAHRRLLAEELDLELPADLAALTERLRSEPVPPTGQGREPLVRKTADRPLTAARPGSDRPASPAQRPSPTGDPGPRPRRLHLTLRYGLAAILLGAVVLLAMRLGSESLAEAVAREMGRQEPGNSALPPPEQRTRSTRAYELYSAASDPDSLRGDRSARRSLRSCQDAVALDSTYAAAWACVARFALRVMLDPQMSGSTDGLLAQAEAAASRAVALDGSTGMNHATLGVVRLAGFELRDAEAHLVRATDLDPDHPLIRQWLVGLYLWTGRTEEALAEARRALELAPADAAAKAEYARALAARARCREALDVLEEIRDLDPPLLRRASIAARCHARTGAWQEAIELLRAQSHRGKVGDGLEGYMLARAGRIGEARALRSHLVDRWRQNGTGALGIAAVSAGLGETDEAFAWLDRALEDRSLVPYEFQYQTLAIIAESLDHDPRLDALFERIGLRGL